MDLAATGPCKICKGKADVGVAFVPSLHEHREIHAHYKALGWAIDPYLEKLMELTKAFTIDELRDKNLEWSPAFMVVGGLCEYCLTHQAETFSEAMLFDLLSKPTKSQNRENVEAELH